MTNSQLVDHVHLSPNNYGRRKYNISRISPHCVVGQCSVETLGNIFAPTSRGASSNYGIGADGRVGMYVEESNASWCTSDYDNDNRAVTIECASDTYDPYAFKDVVYNKLIELCVDICKRNGKTKLLWLGDKATTLNYCPGADEMVLTVHRWFKNKSCPGDWMFSRMGDLAEKVTAELGGVATQPTPVSVDSNLPSDSIIYRVQVGAFKVQKYAYAFLDKVQEKFPNAYVKKVGDLYKIQIGAFKVKANADNYLKTVKNAGFDAFIDARDNGAVVEQKITFNSNVKLKEGSKTYTGGNLSSYVYSWTLKVKDINGDRVVVTHNGVIIAAVKLSDLKLA